jgi:hypothetical protein
LLDKDADLNVKDVTSYLHFFFFFFEERSKNLLATCTRQLSKKKLQYQSDRQRLEEYGEWTQEEVEEAEYERLEQARLLKVIVLLEAVIQRR